MSVNKKNCIEKMIYRLLQFIAVITISVFSDFLKKNFRNVIKPDRYLIYLDQKNVQSQTIYNGSLKKTFFETLKSISPSLNILSNDVLLKTSKRNTLVRF